MKIALALLIMAGVAYAKPPHGATRVVLDYTYASFHRAEHHYTLEWKDNGYVAGKRAVDAKLVAALYSALGDLREVDHELRCISHTDDYPSFTVTVAGDEPIIVGSESNCHGGVPWMIKKGDKYYAQFSGAAGRAVRALFAAADPDTWKDGGDSPEASTAFGGEPVGLDQLPGKDAAACAKAFESDARALKALGENVHVSELELGCDLSQSADCTKTFAEAAFLWLGVKTQLEFSCTGGKPDGFEPALAEARKFLASKPVRAMVKILGHDAPRTWKMGGWQLEGGSEGPMLGYDPKSGRISARAFGGNDPPAAAFWKELGIDAKKLSKKDDSWYEVNATLDLAGKLVKN
jgi:hypothetical protein